MGSQITPSYKTVVKVFPVYERVIMMMAKDFKFYKNKVQSLGIYSLSKWWRNVVKKVKYILKLKDTTLGRVVYPLLSRILDGGKRERRKRVTTPNGQVDEGYQGTTWLIISSCYRGGGGRECADKTSSLYNQPPTECRGQGRSPYRSFSITS